METTSPRRRSRVLRHSTCRLRTCASWSPCCKSGSRTPTAASPTPTRWPTLWPRPRRSAGAARREPPSRPASGSPWRKRSCGIRNQPPKRSPCWLTASAWRRKLCASGFAIGELKFANFTFATILLALYPILKQIFQFFWHTRRAIYVRKSYVLQLFSNKNVWQKN